VAPPPVATPPVTPPPVAPPPGTAPPLPPVPPVPGPLQPLKLANLVVGNAVTLAAGDEALLDILEANGFFVTPIDDADQPDQTSTTIDLVVISPSAAANTVAAKYRNIRQAVLVMNFALFDDMRMTGTTAQTNFGSTAGREVAIVAGQEVHPLAGGLTGTVAVANANGPLNWGQPAATATAVATLVGNPGRAVIFGYEAATQMQGQMAPARRVAFFASAAMVERLSPDGEKLLVAAAKWASSGPPPALPPIGQ
jgi:hypothetical protein